MQTKKRYDYLDLLKFIAIIMVMCLHVQIWSDNFIEDKSVWKVFSYACRLISEGVPIFVAVNGFLLLKKSKLDLKKHIRKMVIIFFDLIIWAVIIILTSCITMGFPDDFTVRTFLTYMLETGLGAKYTGVLWFLEYLLGVYIVYPVIWSAYHNDFKIFKAFFIVATILLPGIDCLKLFNDFIAIYSKTTLISEVVSFITKFSVINEEWYLYYFCLGGMLYHYKAKLKEKMFLFLLAGIGGWILACAFGYFMSVKLGHVYNDTFNSGSIFMVIIVVGLFAVSQNFEGDKNIITKIICDAGQKTFGIYVTHIIVIRALGHICPVMNFGTRIVILILTFVICYLFTTLVSKIRPIKWIVLS